MTNDRTTVAVLGPGGVGGLLAALLARAGHRVICLAGPETAETLRTDGIRLRSARFGAFTAPVEADTVLRTEPDAVLIAVKHTALEASLARIPSPPWATPSSCRSSTASSTPRCCAPTTARTGSPRR